MYGLSFPYLLVFYNCYSCLTSTGSHGHTGLNFFCFLLYCKLIYFSIHLVGPLWKSYIVLLCAWLHLLVCTALVEYQRASCWHRGWEFSDSWMYTRKSKGSVCSRGEAARFCSQWCRNLNVKQVLILTFCQKSSFIEVHKANTAQLHMLPGMLKYDCICHHDRHFLFKIKSSLILCSVLRHLV